MATWSASTRDELETAFADAATGEVIRVPEGSVIDASGLSFTSPPHGGKLVAGSGAKDRPAATIIKKDFSRNFIKAAGDFEVSGLNFIGPEHDRIPLNDAKIASCLHLYGDRATVGGCAFYGWPQAAVELGSRKSETESVVRNSTFRHCLMDGYGYGIELYNGHATVRNCDFDFTRHAIAAFGYPTCGYEARYNRVGPFTLSHAFDMHALVENLGEKKATDRGFDPVTAGGDVHIHHNVFQFTHDLEGRPQEAIAIRGVPDGQCVIHDNEFAHATAPSEPGGQGEAFRQQRVDEWTRVAAVANEYGVGKRGW